MRFLLLPLCLAALMHAQPTVSLPPILLPWEADVHTNKVDNQPYPAHRIAGNLYYVGTAGYASFLITSDQGHILINPNFDDSVPLVQKSVEELGFRFRDIKIVLISHAHGDHCAGTARVKEFTGAQVMVMDADVETMENGAKGTRTGFPPVKVSRILHDKEEVSLGDSRLIAHITPGHTKGNTTYTMKVEDGGKSYDVVILGSANVNDAHQLFNNKDYPHMLADFLRTFEVLKGLPCDIFLASHGKFYGLADKYAKLGKGGPNPFIDAAGYRAHVDLMEKAFYYKMDWVKRGN
ncbi:MAG: subclass B3 metallo-beta-lactamase [Bryobacteraceae bacterium]